MLAIALLGNAFLRIAGRASGVLVGLYLAALANQGRHIGAAAGVPPLLAHIADVTEHNPALRARAMSYFELSLLAGLALGGLLGAQLWRIYIASAFAAVALFYLLSAALLFVGTKGSRGHGFDEAFAGFKRAIQQPSLRRLAPVWLCVNSIVGLWLGPTLTFLLVQKSHSGQMLAGIYACSLFACDSSLSTIRVRAVRNG